MDRNKEQEGLIPTALEQVIKELDMARSLANGPGAIPDLLTPENFPLLAKHSAASLDALRGIAEDTLGANSRNVRLSQEYPEAWTCPNDNRRKFLLEVALICIATGDRELYDNCINATYEQLRLEVDDMMQSNYSKAKEMGLR